MLVKIFVFLLVLFSLLPKAVFAQTSCCSANGGAYACDYSTSTLYCKDGSVSRECSCRQATPTPTLSPTPSPVPTLPACVTNSSYDTNIKACKCNSGYVVKDNSCVTFRDFCWSTFGGNSNYDSEKNGCTCASGYALSSNNTSCISYDEVCRNGLGDKSSYNKENNNCVCHSGYSIQENKCLPIPSPALSPQVNQINISKIPSPTPSNEPNMQKNSATPNMTITPEKQPTLIVKNGGNFIAEKKPQENIIKKIFSRVLNFFSRIFN